MKEERGRKGREQVELLYKRERVKAHVRRNKGEVKEKKRFQSRNNELQKSVGRRKGYEIKKKPQNTRNTHVEADWTG